MKKTIMIFLVLLLLTGCSTSSKTLNEDVKQIGVVQFSEHPALDNATKGFIQALSDNGFKDGVSIDIDKQNAQSDFGNAETIATKFVNDQKDLIFANATPVAQAVKAKTDDIPIVITSVTDPESSGLVESNTIPSNNVTGTSDLTPVKEQIALLNNIIEDVKKVGVMYSSSEDNSLFQVDIAVKELNALNIEPVVTSVSDSTMIQSSVESLIGKVDAIYLPTDNLMAENMSSITSIAHENNIPVICGESGGVVLGSLATFGLNYYNIGYKAGEMAVEILNGKNPNEMPIEYAETGEFDFTVNKSSALQLGIDLNNEALKEATIIE